MGAQRTSKSPRPGPTGRSAKPGEARPNVYRTRSVVRACGILKCFDRQSRELGLEEIASSCALNKSTTFRLLQTLVECGMVRAVARNRYALGDREQPRWKYRLGYASQTEEFSFSRLVSDSIRSSAYEAGLDLLVLDNSYSPKAAIRNAESFVRERVDLVIEFQTDHRCSATVAAKLAEAKIPTIAIDIPHPGSDYYGANNYRAGLMGGHALAQACERVWQGKADEIVLLELPMAGPLPQARLLGMLAGLREHPLHVPESNVRFIDGNGRFEKSLDAMRRYLRRTRARRILLGAVNDPSCLGALQAFEEAGRAEHCLAMSQNGCIESRREMRRAGSRLVGAVGFFPEHYGEAVIRLALDKLRGRMIPPATFVKHRLISRENVDILYPNDRLIPAGDSDSLLWSLR